MPGAFAAYTKIIHRNGRNQNTKKKKNDITCFAKGTQPCPEGFSLKKWVGPEKAVASAGHMSPRTP